jgi:hypothetical protein
MGMFDVIIVESAVPDAGAAEVTKSQTEDFPDPQLENYEVTVDGRLLLERIHHEDRSDRECRTSDRQDDSDSRGLGRRSFPGHPEFLGRQVFRRDARSSSGPRTFGEDLPHPERAEWFESNAKFTVGQLVSIERVVRQEY